VRPAGTRRRGGGTPRRGRHAAEVDELAETARHRLRSALGSSDAPREGGLVGGWVPQPPPDAGPVRAATGRPWLSALRDRLPVGRHPVALAPSGRALVGLLLVVTVAVATTGATAWVARPEEHPAPGRPRVVGQPLTSPSPVPATGRPSAGPAPGSASAATSGASATVLLVHVAGAVRRPGLVELPPGARVADAVEAAGGVTRIGDPASVNLARPAIDGEQVVVARRGEGVLPAPVAVPPGTAATGSPAAPVDLNTATLKQLDALPGIGPVLAQRILDWRTANGRFSVVDELGEVSGIGEATLTDLRPLVTV
jgi:competence protein ComEA